MPKSQEREADWLSLSQHPALVQPAVVRGAERWGTNRICGTLPCGGVGSRSQRREVGGWRSTKDAHHTCLPRWTLLAITFDLNQA